MNEENIGLWLSGLGPKKQKEEVDQWKEEVDTFQKKVQILAKENADLCDSVHHLAQMVLTGSLASIGVDKAIQAGPTIIEKKVETVTHTYTNVLSQT